MTKKANPKLWKTIGYPVRMFPGHVGGATGRGAALGQTEQHSFEQELPVQVIPRKTCIDRGTGLHKMAFLFLL